MRLVILIIFGISLGSCATHKTAFSHDGEKVVAGMTKAEVTKAWGEPNEKDSEAAWFAVTSDTAMWHYDFATVFFEEGTVARVEGS